MTTQAFPNAIPAGATVSTGRLWAGRAIHGLATLFLLMDGVMKLVKPAAVVQATARLGFPESALTPIGLVLIACTLLYMVPRTSVLGAILLTGYLGGAVASNVLAGSSAFETVSPVLFGMLLWTGAWLRDGRVRQLAAWITESRRIS